ncbi:MAG: threonine dehydratase [Magnetovibrionaceae bacterium]
MTSRTESQVTLTELNRAAETVYAHMAPTAQICWPLLSARVGAEVWVKHENHTPIGAFKVRGGLVYMDDLKKRAPDCGGIITATRGNHGQSVGLAAKHFGFRSTIVVPHGNNPEKNRAMNGFGVDLREVGEDFQAAADWAAEKAEAEKLHMIPPFHPLLVAGVGTYAMEFFKAQPDLDVVYVPIGMGSGISGVISARDALGLKTDVVGVVAEGAPAYGLSFEAGRVVRTNKAETLADGMACRSPNADAVEIINRGAARVVQVSDEAIAGAMACYFTDTHNLAEGAGAAPLAAALQERMSLAGRKVGLVLSGGNVDRHLLSDVLSRFGDGNAEVQAA